jgi:DNA polymerase I-like protein with 3'-5' exonuclease and polymerase domains
MREIEAEVEPSLPARKIPKSRIHQPPVKRFNKDGNPSAIAVRYFGELLTNCGAMGENDWKVKYPHGYVPLSEANEPLAQDEPMRLANQSDIKAWLMEQGWQPTMWNERKLPDGSKVRSGPKFTDLQKNLCPNLVRMQDKVPLVKPIVLWLTYRNRRNIIQSENGTGWLNHPRLKVDHRLPSGADTIGTNTSRFTHKVVANVPRVTSVFGGEMRELFIVPEGRYMVGWDAAALEARMEAHYTAKYDHGAYAKELMEGDIHTKNAEIFGVDRNTAKTLKYALTYGARPKKISVTLGVPEWRGKEIYEAFWESNWALARVRDTLNRFCSDRGGKYIPGLDGRKVPVRSEHARLNALFQSAGIICMKNAMVLMEQKYRDSKIARGLIRYHKLCGLAR